MIYIRRFCCEKGLTKMQSAAYKQTAHWHINFECAAKKIYATIFLLSFFWHSQKRRFIERQRWRRGNSKTQHRSEKNPSVYLLLFTIHIKSRQTIERSFSASFYSRSSIVWALHGECVCVSGIVIECFVESSLPLLLNVCVINRE